MGIYQSRIYPIILLNEVESYLNENNLSFETTMSENTKEESQYFNVVIEYENIEEYNKILEYEKYLINQLSFWIKENIESKYVGHCFLFIKTENKINKLISIPNITFDKTIFEYQIMTYKNINSVLNNHKVIKKIEKFKNSIKHLKNLKMRIKKIEFHFFKKSKIKLLDNIIKLESKKMDIFSIDTDYQITS